MYVFKRERVSVLLYQIEVDLYVMPWALIKAALTPIFWVHSSDQEIEQMVVWRAALMKVRIAGLVLPLVGGGVGKCIVSHRKSKSEGKRETNAPSELAFYRMKTGAVR